MALITQIDKISKALENSDFVNGVFLDFLKAFDPVDHRIIAQKIAIYGYQGIVLNWFDSYLSNRMQYVTCNSEKSN